MKKLIFGLLIVLPIAILMVVGLVTAFISNAVKVSVEDVSLDPHSLVLEIGEYELDELFTVTIYPEAAANSPYEWTIKDVRSRDENYDDDDNGTGGVYFAELLDADGNHVDTVSAGGRLRVTVHCSFTLEVSAETITDSCSVVVGGDVSSVRLYAATDVKVGESAKLSAVYTPLDGTATDLVWSVSDDSVLRVDRNGIITGVSAGSAEVTLTVTNAAGKKVTSEPFAVTVDAALTPYGDTLFIGANSFDLNGIGLSGSDVLGVKGGAVEGNEFSFADEADTATLTLGGGTVTLHRCAEGAIEIIESAVLGEDYILEMGGEPVYLSARYLSVLRRGETPAVRWSSDKPSVASVDDGVVHGLVSGEATVSAECDGETASVTFAVRRTVAVLVTETTQSSLQAGLALETVFGSRKYDADGTLTDNTYSVNILYPALGEGENAEVFYEAFEFTTDRPDLASFNSVAGDGINNNTLVFNSAAIAEAAAQSEDGRIDIKVTVRAKYPRYAGMESYTTTSFVIAVIDGIAVGDYESLNNALSVEKSAVVLTDDIEVADTGKGVAETINTFGDVYGNGFTVWSPFGLMGSGERAVFTVCANDISFSNLTIRINSVDREGGELEFGDVGQFTKGQGIKVETGSMNKVTGQNFIENPQITGIRVEYCLIENGRSLLSIMGGEVTLDGCVLRNSSTPAVYLGMNFNDVTVDGTKTRVHTYNNISINNCVFSNMAGLALGFGYVYDGYRESATGRTTLTQTGFMDIYNWQPSDNLVLLPLSMLEDFLGGQTAEWALGILRNAVINEPALDGFRRTIGAETYMHLGFFSAGLVSPSYLTYGYAADGRLVDRDGYICEVNDKGRIVTTDEKLDSLDGVSWNMSFEDERVKYFSSNDVESIKSALSLLGMDDAPAVIFAYDNETTDLVPGTDYTINSRFVARLHSGD